ncbi:MAG: DUF721 domain-containing protein [Leptolyngbya sp. SIO4C1]|nr:DUF721 domain-containing protein [Leptolyngbya sp. SIO4C1]
MSLEGLNGLIQGLEAQASWQARRQFRLVVMYWPKAVGYAVAQQTRPVSLQRQVLQVAVSSAAWAQTLAFERRRILQKLNARIQPALKDIRFSPGQWTAGAAPRRLADLSELSHHPSYIGPDAVAPVDEEAARSQTPIAAFQRWAQLVQAQHRRQSVCPQCGCACPSGEMARWQCCALCVAKSWQSLP